MKVMEAGLEDDAALRKLIRQDAMPGWVQLAYCREPSFFRSLNVQGKCNEVVAAKEQNALVGMGCRSIKPVWVNGERMNIGYLSGLRIAPSARGGSLLARGYARLRHLHAACPVPLYLTTIIEDNHSAMGVLTGARAGLPQYREQGSYLTHALCLKPTGISKAGPLKIQRGDSIPLQSLLTFIQHEGARYQFFPILEAEDFENGYLQDLTPADFYVAMHGEKIQGVMARWDQSAFKQIWIQNYSPPLRYLRPLLNQGLRCAGYHALPPAGTYLNVLYIAFVCIQQDNPEVFHALLASLLGDTRNAKFHWALLGMHERHPLLPSLHSYRSLRYGSRLYFAVWEDAQDFCKNLDKSRVPYLELATL
jgi:hypothetical protein